VVSEPGDISLEKQVQSNENTPNKKTRESKKIANSHTFKEQAVKYLLKGQYNDLLKNEDV
jgi:hypothetical protein